MAINEADIIPQHWSSPKRIIQRGYLVFLRDSISDVRGLSVKAGAGPRVSRGAGRSLDEKVGKNERQRSLADLFPVESTG